VCFWLEVLKQQQRICKITRQQLSQPQPYAKPASSASTARLHARELLCRSAMPATNRKPSACHTQYNGSLFHRDYVCRPRESGVAGWIQLWLYPRRGSRQVPNRVLADSALTTLLYAERPETPPQPSCFVPFRRDPHFVHSGTLLDQVRERCAAPASRIALVGLGGVG
jgi:hypothetical protein